MKREKYKLSSSDINAALADAQRFLSEGKYFFTLDIIEELIGLYPQLSTQLLVNAYDIYQAIPDKESRYWLYQARHFDFKIEPGWKVMDIGSGHIPFPFATHLGDIALEDGKYGRAGAPFKYIDGKPVFECNVEDLPFADKEFDFIYCSHVLEHTHNPEKACSELMRVAKRGYIETPTHAKDLFLDTAAISNHLWKVENFNKKLVFTEYTSEGLKGLNCDILMQMHCAPQSDREKAFSALVLLKSEEINTMMMWDQSFDVEVRRLNRS